MRLLRSQHSQTRTWYSDECMKLHHSFGVKSAADSGPLSTKGSHITQVLSLCCIDGMKGFSAAERWHYRNDQSTIDINERRDEMYRKEVTLCLLGHFPGDFAFPYIMRGNLLPANSISQQLAATEGWWLSTVKIPRGIPQWENIRN